MHYQLAVHALKLSMKFLPSPLTTYVTYVLASITLDMLNSHSITLYVTLYTASLKLQAVT